MEKEKRNLSNSMKKGEKRKRNRKISHYYRKTLRLLKKRRKTVLAVAACALAVCCLALVVWALVRILPGGNVQEEMETVVDVEGEPIDTTEPLQENAYPEVNELVAKYFAALQEGDEEALTGLRDNTADKDLLRMQENSSHIESYSNIVCYTKSGLEADSYVVFAYYEVKFQDIDTLLPGIAPLYVKKNAEGQYYLHDMDQDEEAAAYVNDVAAQDDVAALYEQVNAEYQNRLEQDETLSAFVEGYMSDMMVAVGEALEEQTQAASESAAAETVQETQTQSEEEAAESASPDAEQTASSSQVPNSGEFTVSETVNIRSGVSETSEKIAVVYPGETLEILMKQADGWTRVSYQGQVGYVRSDVLK